MLTDKSFENLSNPISGIAESFTLRLLKRIAGLARKLASDPGMIVNINNIISEVEKDHRKFVEEAEGWVDETLPVAYMRGIKETEAQIAKLKPDASSTAPIAAQVLSGGHGGSIKEWVRKVLAEYSEHHTMYAVFQNDAYNDFANTRLPVVRDVRGKIRELIIESSENQYRGADSFTRRQMTQDLVNRFADNNITGITYSNGRRVNLDSYAEMVARSQTGNAAREASMNRQQQFGFDLVRISTHYPTSDLCEPYQGHVFSISGESDQYPALDEAINGGLYHSNCLHFQNPYFPGISPKQDVRQEELGKRENRRRYELTQKQRYNERQIKSWKRREATAITDVEMKNSSKKVIEWQNNLESLVNEHSFLRMKDNRVTIQSGIHPRQRYKRAGIPWEKSKR